VTRQQHIDQVHKMRAENRIFASLAVFISVVMLVAIATEGDMFYHVIFIVEVTCGLWLAWLDSSYRDVAAFLETITDEQYEEFNR